MKAALIPLFQIVSDFVYLYPLFMSFVWIVGGLIFHYRLERRSPALPALDRFPFFSILIPCHNEEKQIRKTVTQLFDLDYPDYEIILIDDGSSDGTAAILRELCKTHEKVRSVYVKTNQGKATALNLACAAARGELILTMDADAFLDPKALKWLAWHFVYFPRVGAVTGNPRVLNRTTLIAKIQTGEYSTIIGLIKRTQRILGKVLTVSGVIAAFRRKALVSAGLWDTDMVTEDIDITWKLERRFWDIRYEPRAICWILVPETLKGLWRQRLRWSQGGVEVLKKHVPVWRDWRQRRLWPVYLEYMFSVAWAYAFWTLVILWGIGMVAGWESLSFISPPVPPSWTGSLLALACVSQFVASLYMDHRYEKGMLRYLFWVIWYPFMYWMISSITVLVATPRALLKKSGTRAVWRSPDRGLELPAGK
jgi:biofilm PGA synthesis N-glycosyltransferase PgaC